MRCTIPICASVGTTDEDQPLRGEHGDQRRPRQERVEPAHQSRITCSKSSTPATTKMTSKATSTPAAPPAAPTHVSAASRGLHAADQHRHQQRQQEDGQHHLARRVRTVIAAKSVASAANPRLPSARASRSAGSTGPTSTCSSTRHERHHERLHDAQQHHVGRELAEVERGGIERRREQAAEAVVLALEDEAALDAEQSGEDERRPQHARREARRVRRRRIERHAEDDDQQHAERPRSSRGSRCVRHSMRRSFRRTASAPRARSGPSRDHARRRPPRATTASAACPSCRPGDAPAVQDGDAASRAACDALDVVRAEHDGVAGQPQLDEQRLEARRRRRDRAR